MTTSATKHLVNPAHLDMQMDELLPCKVMIMSSGRQAAVVFAPNRLPVVFDGTARYRVVMDRGDLPSVDEALAVVKARFPGAPLDEHGPLEWQMQGDEDVHALVVYVSKMDKAQ